MELDGLRGVSLWLVLAVHVCYIAVIDMGRTSPIAAVSSGAASWGSKSLLETITGRGYIGVPIFFTLSGFLLAGPFIRWRVLEDDRVPTGAFFLRRLTRIQPPYMVALAASMGLVAFGAHVSFGNFVASALYVHQPVFGQANPAIVPAWSLEVEMQWYLVIPVVAVLLSSRDRMRRALVASGLAVGALWFQIAVDATSTRTDAALLSWLQFFLVGWMICDLQQTARRRIASSFRWDVAAALAWPGLFVVAGIWSLQITLGPLLIGALLIAALRGRAMPWLLRRAWLVQTGRLSYPAFLIHYPLFLAIRHVLGPSPAMSFPVSFAYWSAVLLPPTFLAAAAFHRWIEQPCADGRLLRWVQARMRTVHREQREPELPLDVITVADPTRVA